MKFKLPIAVVVTALLLGGCAGTVIGLRSTNSPSLPGNAPALAGSRSAAAIQVDVSPGAFFGLVLLGYLAGGVQNGYRHSTGAASWRNPPELAGERAIAERDCSRPLGYLEANLRCE